MSISNSIDLADALPFISLYFFRELIHHTLTVTLVLIVLMWNMIAREDVLIRKKNGRGKGIEEIMREKTRMVSMTAESWILDSVSASLFQGRWRILQVRHTKEAPMRHMECIVYLLLHTMIRIL
jgi:hypothetical protein